MIVLALLCLAVACLWARIIVNEIIRPLWAEGDESDTTGKAVR